ncbi:MAG TPA: NADH-quinone oxidoreductase subunit NuoK [Candidatus Krumholzibacteriaceae bacterium]|nr:NADH-quinone oxidoreductase subunit NuoK [Candidatus Krumholzibacteriaceae bacterium]
MIPLSYYLTFAFTLFIIGFYCLVTKRNMIRLILGIELMVNAANFSFIVFSSYWHAGFIDPLAHSFVIISTALVGSVTAVALTIVVYAYRHYGTLDVRKLKRLRG